MSRLVYFDCASGASGDMLLGALVDLGLPIDSLRQELAKLPKVSGDTQLQLSSEARRVLTDAHAVGLLGEDQEQVRDLELGVALGLGELLGADDRLGRALGESIGSHRSSSTSVLDRAGGWRREPAPAACGPLRRAWAAPRAWSRSGLLSEMSLASAGHAP